MRDIVVFVIDKFGCRKLEPDQNAVERRNTGLAEALHSHRPKLVNTIVAISQNVFKEDFDRPRGPRIGFLGR
jgi:hypothetical protein